MKGRITALCLVITLVFTLFTAMPVSAEVTTLNAADVKSFNSGTEILPSASVPDEVLVASAQALWGGATTFTDTDGTLTEVPTLDGSTFATARNTVIAFSVPSGMTSTGLKSATLNVTAKKIKQVTTGNRLAVYGHSLDTPWAGTTITKETFGADGTTSILDSSVMPLLGLTDSITAGNKTGEAVSNQTLTLSSKALTAYVREMLDDGKTELTFQYATSKGGIWLYSLNAATESYKPTLSLDFGVEANASLNYVCGGESIGTKALGGTWLNEEYTVSEDDAPLYMTIADTLYVRQSQNAIKLTPTEANEVFDVEYVRSAYKNITVKTVTDTGLELASDIIIENVPAYTEYTYTGSYEQLIVKDDVYYGFDESATNLTISVTEDDNVISIMYKECVVTENNVISEEGATCWFGDPRSIHYENETLGINATYTGYIDVHGSIKATQYDHNTDTVKEVLIRSNFQPDDHDSPTWIALPDGRIMVFYSRHTDEARFFYRVSTTAGDITTLGDEKILAMANNTTYPNPFILANDPDHIYLCWRGINWHPTIGRLTMPDANGDCNFDWGPKQIVASTIQGSGCRPYAKYCSDGVSKIYMTYSSTHPDNVANVAIYCNYIDIGNAENDLEIKLRDMAGNEKSTIDTAPFSINGYETNSLFVVDSTATSQRGWVWDIALENNSPVIAMVRISSDKQQHNYYCATYDADTTTWNKVHLDYAGKYFHKTTGVEQCYSGGMTLNHENPHEFYASVPVTGIYGDVYEIVKYTMNSDFSAITSKEQITQNSKLNNVRPVYTRNASADGKMALTWMQGDYYYWIVNSTYKQGFPTSMVTNTTIPREENPDITSTKVFEDDSMRQATENSAALDAQLPSGSFTAAFYALFDSNYSDGTMFEAGDFKAGVTRTTLDNTGDAYGQGDGATVLPYINAKGETYSSINRFSDSDWMQNHGSTTDGSKGTDNMGWIHYAITYDAATGVCETYVNGLLDQHIVLESGLSAAGEAKVGAFAGEITGISLYSSVLSQDAIRAAAAQTNIDKIKEQSVYDAFTISPIASKDLDLPTAASDGTAISWASSDEAVVSDIGAVTRGYDAQSVTLSATFSFALLGTLTKEFTVTVPARRNVSDDMFLRYDFDEANTYQSGSATFVRDITGQGNDALICGSATVTDGKLDLTQNTLTGFATNGYANITTPVLLGLHSYSVVSKVNFTTLEKLPRIYDIGADGAHSMFCRANALCAGIKNSNTLMENATSQLSTGVDVYVTVTYDTQTKLTKVYVDNTLVASGTTITHEPYMLGASTRNYIGRTQWWDNNSDNADMIGTIDEFRMYSSALSDTDIAAIIEGTDPTPTPIENTEPSFTVDFDVNAAKVGNATVNLENITEGEVEVILGAYSADTLIFAQKATATITDGSGSVSFIDFDASGVDNFKVFAWSKTKTLEPLFELKEFAQ